MRTTNTSVPAETVWRNAYNNALVTIDRLNCEVASLKAQLEIKNKAITDFKAWQKKTLKKGWKGIVSEAVNLLDNFPRKEEVQPLFDFLAKRESFLKRVNRLEFEYQKVLDKARKAEAAKERALTIVNNG